MTKVTITVQAMLFDMDGTLIDSVAGVIGAWKVFAVDYPGLDLQEILRSSHGVRTIESLETHCKIHDPVKLQQEAIRFEQLVLDAADHGGRQGIVRLPGVTEMVAALQESTGIEGQHAGWAICTSATRKYATQALFKAGVPQPGAFVTADDVQRGKPQPDPYLLGARLLGVDPSDCIVIEDAPSGIRSGQAAGCKTLAVLTSHTRDRIEPVNPTFLVKDLSSVSVKRTSNGVEVTMDVLE